VLSLLLAAGEAGEALLALGDEDIAAAAELSASRNVKQNLTNP
jgi:hypothetical protein